MNTYKNLEIYQSAFNLAIKVYRLNITLPVTALLNQGNKLRWTSLRMKDMIAEGFSGQKETDEMIRILNIIVNLNSEVIGLLKKIRTHNPGNRQVPELINAYKELGHKMGEHIDALSAEKTEYRIRFPESFLMDKAG